MKDYKLDIVENVRNVAERYYLSEQNYTDRCKFNSILADNFEVLMDDAFRNGEESNLREDWESGCFIVRRGDSDGIGIEIESDEEYYSIDFVNGYDVTENWESLVTYLPPSCLAYIILCMMVFCNPITATCSRDISELNSRVVTLNEESNRLSKGIRSNRRENTLNEQSITALTKLRERASFPLMICDKGGFVAQPSQHLPIISFGTMGVLGTDKGEFEILYTNSIALDKVTKKDVDAFEGTLILIVEILLNMNEPQYIPFNDSELTNSHLRLMSFMDNIRTGNTALLESIEGYVKGKYDINNRKRWTY